MRLYVLLFCNFVLDFFNIDQTQTVAFMMTYASTCIYLPMYYQGTAYMQMQEDIEGYYNSAAIVFEIAGSSTSTVSSLGQTWNLCNSKLKVDKNSGA